MSVHENNNTSNPEASTASPSALQQAYSINILKEGRVTNWSLLMAGIIEVMLRVFIYSCLEPQRQSSAAKPHVLKPKTYFSNLFWSVLKKNLKHMFIIVFYPEH